ncbi:hypothetical protein RDI58_024179 [Solanum bulbocastanum]|uniref:Retroviral polymerase SH3-like domain-containing protein n=1 Tax=Solanum bulbocastanum TaxID=147425 RepID=A0AAN8Y379_SOLBU
MNNSNKFESKVIPSVFMVYSKVTKEYMLYDLIKHVFFINRDVTFQENSFSFPAHQIPKSTFVPYVCCTRLSTQNPPLLLSILLILFSMFFDDLTMKIDPLTQLVSFVFDPPQYPPLEPPD